MVKALVKKYYAVGGKRFQTKSLVLEKLRSILHGYQPKEMVSEEDCQFLLSVLEKHPEKEEKIGVGVVGFRVMIHPIYETTRAFFVVRKDGTEEDFSFMKCLREVEKIEEKITITQEKSKVPQRAQPDYSIELPEILYVSCWKINEGENGTMYPVFFDRDNRLYRTGMTTKRFCEGGYYAIKARQKKLKVSSTGKEYVALHGIHILHRMTKYAYFHLDQNPPKSKYNCEDIVRWIDGDDCEVKEGIIVEMEYDGLTCLWKYLVRCCDEQDAEAVIAEVDIIDEEEKQ